ncbi:MAG TPA: protein kinase [Planctomycetota bacterium]|nr:protein kinase [Planctomycetota bacterium]
MDDVGTLVAKLALRSKLISPAQFETVSQAYAKSGGRKPYGAILLESGILNGGALTKLLHEHQRRISTLVEDIFAKRILEKGYATEEALRDSHATLEDIRVHGFDFDMLELLVKRNAISHPQAAELRQHLRTKILICPICLRTEPRNGHEGAVSCPECHENFSPGASDRLMSRFVTVAAMFPSQGPAAAGGPPSTISGGGSDIPPQLGAYRVGREVGRGGMAVVYDAEDLRTGERVALKVLKPGSALDKSNISRFYSEIESLQKLDHPNVVRVFGVGEAAGHHFYAMQFIDGKGLDRMVNECKQDLRRAVAWIRDVARALHSAHDRGIVHRDVKPGNILVDRQGRAFLTDFGLALRDRAVRVTLSGTTLGTPNFMSPEQARGERNKLDRRTDVYSLGATLYNLSTGRVPYWENTPELVVQKILNEDPKPPTTLNAAIDKSLQTIIFKAMDKDPDHRYPSAAEMADDLGRWLAGEPIHATPSTSRLKVLKKWWNRNRRTVLIAGISAGAASLLAGVLFLRQLSVTETIESELTRSEAERERFRQSRKAPAERYAEDLQKAQRDARELIADKTVEFDRELAETLSGVRKVNEREKTDPVEAAKKEQWAVVNNRRDLASALAERGEIDLKRGAYASALIWLRRAEQIYREVASFKKTVADKKVLALLEKHPGFADILAVEPQLNALDDSIARCRSYEVWLQWLADKDTEKALKAMDEIVPAHSGRAEPLIRRGLIHVRAKSDLQAAADFSNVLLKDPKNFSARLGQVELLIRRNQLSEAAVEMTKLPETRRRYGPEVALLEGLRLRKLGDYNAALSVLEHKQDPTAMADLLAGRAACLQALGMYEDAEKLALKADDLLRDLEDRIQMDFARLTGRPELVYDIWSTIARVNLELRIKEKNPARVNAAKAAAKLARKIRPDDQDMIDIEKGILR